MPNTPLGIPYPLLTDSPNGPSQMAALATATDTLLTAALATGDFYGETQGAATVNLTVTGTWVAMPDTKVTFTLATQRRVRVKVRFKGSAGTIPAVIVATPRVVAGSTATLTGSVQGQAGQESLGTSGGPGQQSVDSESSFLLAAGTWTAFVGAMCSNQSDSAAIGGYCAVYDAGGN